MKFRVIFFSLIFFFSCAKKTQELIDVDVPATAAATATDFPGVTPESESSESEISGQAEGESVTETIKEKPLLLTTTEQSGRITAEEQPETDKPVEAIIASVEPEVMDEIIHPEPAAKPEKPITDEQLLDRRPIPISPAIIFPDSSFEEYMIEPGDYLIKIAKKEYNDWRQWREIYKWNREEIGDNPNLIYPYHFLDLLKPRDELKECDLSYHQRSTKSGESLWTIAREVYGDELAWIVLFWDNEETLEANEGALYQGTELKIRNNLDPCNPSS